MQKSPFMKKFYKLLLCTKHSMLHASHAALTIVVILCSHVISFPWCSKSLSTACSSIPTVPLSLCGLHSCFVDADASCSSRSLRRTEALLRAASTAATALVLPDEKQKTNPIYRTKIVPLSRAWANLHSGYALDGAKNIPANNFTIYYIHKKILSSAINPKQCNFVLSHFGGKKHALRKNKYPVRQTYPSSGKKPPRLSCKQALSPEQGSHLCPSNLFP